MLLSLFLTKFSEIHFVRKLEDFKKIDNFTFIFDFVIF